MTRFSAAEQGERQTLFAEAIEAHRTRESPFVTFEAEADAEMAVAPWVQFAAEEGVVNLDCTEDELSALESAVDTFGGATIVERISPESAEGTNLRIAVDGDPERVAMLVETLFQDGFSLPADYRVWVVEI